MTITIDGFANLNRRVWIGALALAAILTLAGCGSGSEDSAQLQATWTASPSDYNAPSLSGPLPAAYIENQTIRQVMHISAGGTGVRVRLSNLFGLAALTIDQVHVARSAGGTQIDTSSDVALTFGGRQAVTIPVGQEVWSDVVAKTLSADSDVTVTLYVAGRMQVGTYHQLGVQQTFVANGNVAAAADVAPITPNQTSYFWVTGIDVQNTTARGTIVAFGDSITDGFNSTLGGSRRYPNSLSKRVLSDASLAGYSVVNAGISGNRILHDVAGPVATGRFERDALLSTGVSHVIILIGINDIGFSNIIPGESVTADQITAGLQQLVDKAKAKGVKVYLATLTPFDHALGPDGNPSPYFDTPSEAKRQQVNTWIRANRAAANGVIDFDAALRDPNAMSRMLPLYDSGDHLHPNDRGYQVMADLVDLSIFR